MQGDDNMLNISTPHVNLLTLHLKKEKKRKEEGRRKSIKFVKYRGESWWVGWETSVG